MPGLKSGRSYDDAAPPRLGPRVTGAYRAYSRRVGDGDVEALVLMPGLAEEIDTAIAEAVRACAPAVTPGPRSAPASASPARPHSSAGEHHLDSTHFDNGSTIGICPASKKHIGSGEGITAWDCSGGCSRRNP